MRFLKNLSIRYKQTLIVLLTSAVALLMACSAFVAYDVVTFRRALLEEVSILAEVVGRNCAAAIDFNDPRSATETLAALRANGSVVAAAVYSHDGRSFAVFQRDGDSAPPPPVAGAAGHEFTGNGLQLFRVIERGGDDVGAIFVTADLNKLFVRLKRYTGIGSSVLLASLLLALVLSSYLQRLLSAPILHLARLTKSVAAEKNYSVRATMQSNDELGQLVDGFNEMLDQIQARDRALMAAQTGLEKRVEERTAALEESKARLQRTEELYRRAIGGAGAVPYSLDYATKTYVFLGDGIADLIGYPAREVNGELWKRIIQESIMLGETFGMDKGEATTRVIEGKVRTWRSDMRVLTRDGKSRWISDVSV